jgi:hypothetical protein
MKTMKTMKTMKKKLPTASALLLGTLLLGGTGCSKIINAPAYQTGSVTHVVLLTLKDKANAANALKQIKDACREMRSIPGVYDIEVGPAVTTAGGSAEFDIGLTVTFRDEAHLKAYGPHPIHKKLADQVFLPLSSKVVAYDFINQEYQ